MRAANTCLIWATVLSSVFLGFVLGGVVPSQAASPYTLETFLSSPECTSVDISPDRTRIYARTMFGDWDEGARAFDFVSYTKIRDYHAFDVPWCILTSADNLYLYGSHYYGGLVDKVSVATDTVVKSVDVGSWTGQMAFDAARRFLYVDENTPGTGSTGSIKVIDTSQATMPVVGSIGLGGEPGCFPVVSPDGANLYVNSWNAGKLYRISTSDYTIKQTYSGLSQHSLVSSLSPDGSKVYVADRGPGLVRVLDALNLTQLETYNIPGIAEFSVSPTGRYALALTGTSVQVFDMTSKSVIQTIATPTSNASAGRIVWDAPTGKAYLPLTSANGGVAVLAPREEKTLAGVPEYEWLRGCAPTSGAMMIGYWAKNGYPNLWDGTPPTSNDINNDSDPVNVVIEHIGDLMKTSTDAEGGTPVPNIPPALVKYAKDKDAAYKFKAGTKYASWDRILHGDSWWEGFSFEYLQKEVNAVRPMSVGLRFKDPLNPLGPFVDHTVVAYGYQDNPGTNNDWIALMDTWVDGASTGGYEIPNKVEGGIEWWKWVTNTDLDYYIYGGHWLIPAVKQHAVWGLLESSFSSATVFEEQFKVASTAAGGASLVTLAGEPKASVLRLVAEGAAGTDDTLLTALVAGAPKVDISFDYAFETPGRLQVLLQGILIGEIVESAGLGVVDELADFSSFFREIVLSDYGLDPDGVYSLELRLLAGSSHIAYLDSLQVVDPDAVFVPEPATLSLLALGGLAVLRRRRR